MKKTIILLSAITSVLSYSASPPKGFGAFVSDNAKGATNYSVAIGEDAEAGKDDALGAVAIGQGSKAEKTYSVAIGMDSEATEGLGSIAIGGNSVAKKAGSISIGVLSKAEKDSSIALGMNTSVKKGKKFESDGSIAIGATAEVAGGTHSLAIGLHSRVIDTGHATAVGVGSYIGALPKTTTDPLEISRGANGITTITKNDDGSYKIISTEGSETELKNRNGDAYGASAYGHRSVALGMGALASGMYSVAIGDESVALGSAAKTYADKAVSVGSRSSALKEGSTAIGYLSDATIAGSVSIGYYSTSDREKGVIGYVPNKDIVDDDSLDTFIKETNTSKETWKATEAAVSIGNKNNKITRQLTNLAAGTSDTDAVNVAQLKSVSETVNKKVNGVEEKVGYLDNKINEVVTLSEKRVEHLDNKINKIAALSEEKIEHLDNKINKVAALSMAASNIEFPNISTGEMSVAAGVGTFANTGAVAVGVAFSPAEDFVVSLKYANVMGKAKHQSFGAGASYKFRAFGK